MRINESCLPYLEGKAFATDLQARFDPTPHDRDYLGRIEFLVRLCKAKTVIHLGCVDHNADTIRTKLSKGKWLHKELCEVTKRCLGVDLDRAGIEFIRELGYPDTLAANVLTDEIPTLLAQEWDYLLIPEVLEHIGNPVQFLTGMRERLGRNFRKLVVTVPNGFARSQTAFTRKGTELINSDHRFWFTPYTLHKVLLDAGFTVDELVLCKHGKVKPRSIFKNLYDKTHPLLRENLVAIASVKQA